MMTDQEIINKIRKTMKSKEAGISNFIITLARRLPEEKAAEFIRPEECTKGKCNLPRDFVLLDEEISELTQLLIRYLRKRDLPMAYKLAYILKALIWLSGQNKFISHTAIESVKEYY